MVKLGRLFGGFACSMLLALSLQAETVDGEAPQYYEDNYIPGPFDNLDPQYDQRNVYWPRSFNDTRDIGQYKLFIYGWEEDPPSSLVLYLYNDSPNLVTEEYVDIRMEVGLFDDARNFMVQNRRILKDVSYGTGWTRVVFNVHNYKGMIVRARLLGVRKKTPIKALD